MGIIRLYPKSELDFTNGGEAILNPILTKCEVTEGSDCTYTLTASATMADPRTKQLAIGKIIVAKPNKLDDPDYFRIYEVKNSIKGTVDIKAYHISYDLNGWSVIPWYRNEEWKNVDDVAAWISRPAIYYTSHDGSWTVDMAGHDGYYYRGWVFADANHTTRIHPSSKGLYYWDLITTKVYQFNAYYGYYNTENKTMYLDEEETIPASPAVGDYYCDLNSEYCYLYSPDPEGSGDDWSLQGIIGSTLENSVTHHLWILIDKAGITGNQNGVLGATRENYRFTVNVDSQVSRDPEWCNRSMFTVRSLLCGSGDQSYIKAFSGYLRFRRYNINHYKSLGVAQTSAVASIQYGGNMKSASMTKTYDSVYSAILPYYISGSNETQKVNTISEGDTVIPIQGALKTVDYSRILALDLSSEFSTDPTDEQMRQYVADYISDNHLAEIGLNGDIELTTEIEDVQGLENMHVWDWIRVINPEWFKTGYFINGKYWNTEVHQGYCVRSGSKFTFYTTAAHTTVVTANEGEYWIDLSDPNNSWVYCCTDNGKRSGLTATLHYGYCKTVSTSNYTFYTNAAKTILAAPSRGEYWLDLSDSTSQYVYYCDDDNPGGRWTRYDYNDVWTQYSAAPFLSSQGTYRRVKEMTYNCLTNRYTKITLGGTWEDTTTLAGIIAGTYNATSSGINSTIAEAIARTSSAVKFGYYSLNSFWSVVMNSGYYYNGRFYTTKQYTTEIVPTQNDYYYDLTEDATTLAYRYSTTAGTWTAISDIETIKITSDSAILYIDRRTHYFYEYDGSSFSQFTPGTSLVYAYHKAADNLFYSTYDAETQTYSNPITGAANTIYVDIVPGATGIYRYDTALATPAFVLIGGGASGVIYAYYKPDDGLFYTDAGYTTLVADLAATKMYVDISAAAKGAFRYDVTNAVFIKMAQNFDDEVGPGIKFTDKTTDGVTKRILEGVAAKGPYSKTESGVTTNVAGVMGMVPAASVGQYGAFLITQAMTGSTPPTTSDLVWKTVADLGLVQKPTRTQSETFGIKVPYYQYEDEAEYDNLIWTAQASGDNDLYLKWNHATNELIWTAVTGGNAVTIDTEQTITGKKTFSQEIFTSYGMSGGTFGSNPHTVYNGSAYFSNTNAAKTSNYIFSMGQWTTDSQDAFQLKLCKSGMGEGDTYGAFVKNIANVVIHDSGTSSVGAQVNFVEQPKWSGKLLAVESDVILKSSSSEQYITRTSSGATVLALVSGSSYGDILFKNSDKGTIGYIGMSSTGKARVKTSGSGSYVNLATESWVTDKGYMLQSTWVASAAYQIPAPTSEGYLKASNITEEGGYTLSWASAVISATPPIYVANNIVSLKYTSGLTTNTVGSYTCLSINPSVVFTNDAAHSYQLAYPIVTGSGSSQVLSWGYVSLPTDYATGKWLKITKAADATTPTISWDTFAGLDGVIYQNGLYLSGTNVGLDTGKGLTTDPDDDNALILNVNTSYFGFNSNKALTPTTRIPTGGGPSNQIPVTVRSGTSPSYTYSWDYVNPPEQSGSNPETYLLSFTTGSASGAGFNWVNSVYSIVGDYPIVVDPDTYTISMNYDEDQFELIKSSEQGSDDTLHIKSALFDSYIPAPDSPNDGDSLIWNGTDSEWKAGTPLYAVTSDRASYVNSTVAGDGLSYVEASGGQVTRYKLAVSNPLPGWTSGNLGQVLTIIQNGEEGHETYEAAWATISWPTIYWSDIESSSKPTTLSGYGITDARINSSTITLGSNSITVVAPGTQSIGDSTTPVYWNGSSFQPAESYANASVDYAATAGSLNVSAGSANTPVWFNGGSPQACSEAFSSSLIPDLSGTYLTKATWEASVAYGITSAKVTAWDSAASNSHAHSNKSTLDGITSAKVTAWDAKQNAIDINNMLDGVYVSYSGSISVVEMINAIDDSKENKIGSEHTISGDYVMYGESTTVNAAIATKQAIIDSRHKLNATLVSYTDPVGGTTSTVSDTLDGLLINTVPGFAYDIASISSRLNNISATIPGQSVATRMTVEEWIQYLLDSLP